MRFVIVTGMSGAGKTTALKMLEDMGYFCVDNLPIAMFPGFVQMIENSETPMKKVALGVDVRSGLGFKYRLQLNNTVGIIDSDYYYSDNEGQIFAKITNDSNEGKTVEVEAGDGFMQGIFVQYGITLDDDVTEVRNGGFGSTTKKK